jgi:dTDP-4-dehydrorhamnose 3,5-epimerase
MIFKPTPIAGVYIIQPERMADDRGYFARTWCAKEFAAHGLETRLAQCSVSFNHRAGTLRGMHYQAAPFGEVKLVRCTSGAIFDVALDLRPDSPTFCRWFGAELSAENGSMLFLPVGVAHGFQTLAGASEVFYQISEFYTAQASRGVRWNDPLFAIAWPLPVSVIAPRDAGYPDSRLDDFAQAVTWVNAKE